MASLTERICLDVGGTKYKVSKSLIEIYPNSMLARLISDTWQKNSVGEIFIDRNGPRFQYVLDYMRDKEAHLAMNVSKKAVLKELEYFGFENVPSGAIDSSCANLEAAKRMIVVSKEHYQTIADLKKTRTDLKTAEDNEVLAHTCYLKYLQTGSLDVSFSQNTQDKPIFDILYGRNPVGTTNEYFAKYSLECTNYEIWNKYESYCSISLQLRVINP